MAFVNHILYAFLRCKEVLRIDSMRMVMQDKFFSNSSIAVAGHANQVACRCVLPRN